MEKLKKQDTKIIVHDSFHQKDINHFVEISNIHTDDVYDYEKELDFYDQLQDKFSIFERAVGGFIYDPDPKDHITRQQLVELLKKEGFENSFLYEDTISGEEEEWYYFMKTTKRFKLKVGDLVFFEHIHSSFGTIEAIEPHGKFPIQVQIGDGKWWMDYKGNFEDGGSHGSVEFYSKVDIKSC